MHPTPAYFVGGRVHYVQPNGAHSMATVTQIHNQESGMVDLFVTRDDSIQGKYNMLIVVYSEKPKAYTWHWMESENGNH